MVKEFLPSLESEYERLTSAWLPRTFDPETGNFHQNWSHNWQPLRDTHRFLVFQSRLLWNTSAIGLFEPAKADAMSTIAVPAARAFWETFWDKKHGGFWWDTDLNGQPLDYCRDQKHLYGHAFAMYAMAKTIQLTGSPEMLANLEEAFEWIDSKAHDELNGGYYDALGLDGRILTSPVTASEPLDFLSSPFGDKDQNSHLHMLEALSEVHRVLPYPLVKARLDEMLEICVTKMLLPGNWLAYQFKPDYTPTSIRPSWGHDIEAAFLIIDARRSLGKPMGKEDEISDAIALKSLDGWDPEDGGLWEAIWCRDANSGKTWWAQAEALSTLAILGNRGGPNEDHYKQVFKRIWRFIQTYAADQEHGGWISEIDRPGTPANFQPKSYRWQGGYHEIRGVINAIQAIRGNDS